MDANEGVLYRMAYGLADQLREAGGYDCQFGRHRTHPAAGGALEVILAEVRRRVRLDQVDGPAAELIRMGVEDALARRRPRW